MFATGPYVEITIRIPIADISERDRAVEALSAFPGEIIGTRVLGLGWCSKCDDHNGPCVCAMGM